MQQSQQQIRAIHNDLSQEVEQPSSTTQWTDDNEGPVRVIIRSDTLKKTLGSLKKLATNLDPKGSLKKLVEGLVPAKLQNYQVS